MAAKGVTLTPRGKRQFLIGILTAAGFVAWGSLFFVPQKRALAQNSLALKELRKQVAQAKSGIDQVPAMEAEIQRLAAEYQIPSVSRPPEEQLPQLLESIAQTARRCQVRLVSAKPTADINKLAPGESGYLELKILIAVSGGYHAIGTFLDALENSGDLLKVLELGISPGGEDQDLFHHVAPILLQAYLVPGSKTGNG